MTDLIDDIDRRLLRALQKDATLSMDALAEKAGLSRNACWRRVKQMEAAGVIRDRITRLDAQKVGLGLSVYVLVRVGRHDAAWLETFQKVIRAMPEVLGAHRMTGDLDYVVRVAVKDVPDYDRFYKRLIAQVPMADISASFVMEDIKDTTVLPV